MPAELSTGELLAILDDEEGSAQPLIDMLQGKAAKPEWKLLLDGEDVTSQCTSHVAVYEESHVPSGRKTPWYYALHAAGTFPLVHCSKKAREALHWMHLDDEMHQRMQKLTKEQQILVWYACMLASDHSIILLPNSPTEGLKKALKGRLTAIYRAKSVADACSADCVLVLHHHQVEAVCTPRELLHAPGSLHVARMADLGEMIPVRVAARNGKGGLALEMDGLVIPARMDEEVIPPIGAAGWLWVERTQIHATREIVKSFHLSATMLECKDGFTASLPNGMTIKCQCDEPVTQGERVFVFWDVSKARFLIDAGVEEESVC